VFSVECTPFTALCHKIVQAKIQVLTKSRAPRGFSGDSLIKTKLVSGAGVMEHSVNIPQMPHLAGHSIRRARCDSRRDHRFEQPV